MGIKIKHIVLIFVLGLIICSLFATTLHIKKNKSVSNKLVGNETIDDTSQTTINGETTEESFAKTTADNSIYSTFLNEETTGIPVNTTAPAETTKTSETTETPIIAETNPPIVNTPPVETQANVHVHSYGTWTIGGGCIPGIITYTCIYCRHSYREEIPAVIDHTYSTWYVTKEATTTETGIKESRCDRCGGEPITEVIPKKTTESSVDSRISVRKGLGGKTIYEYGSCHIWNRRTWGNVLSISILDNGGLHVTYDNKNGEMVEFDVLPIDGYQSNGNILEDGTYTTSYVGAFS